MLLFRYDYGFPGDEATLIEVFFTKEFSSVDQVQEFANAPHGARRAWAEMMINKYKDIGHTVLTPHDYMTEFGRHLQPYYPSGATITVTIRTGRITLEIQVLLFYFSL